jgi:hypothetical protein
MVAGPEGVVAQRILRAVLTLPPPLNGHSSAADRDRPSGAQAPGRDRGDPSEPQGAPIPYRRCPRAPRIAFLRAALKKRREPRPSRCWIKRSRPASAACADARTSARQAMGRLVLPRRPKSNGVVTWPARAVPGSPTKPLRRCPVHGTCDATVKAGNDTWVFMTADFALVHDLDHNTADVSPHG